MIRPRMSRGKACGELMASDCVGTQRLFANSQSVTPLLPSASILGGLPSSIATSRIGSDWEINCVAWMVTGSALWELGNEYGRGVETITTERSLAPCRISATQT